MTGFIAPRQHDSIDDIPEPPENAFLAGHEAVAGALAASYRMGRLHHALMLTGPRGIGKATLAFHLANHLLRFPDASAAPEGLARPDPASGLFRAVAQGAHPSVLHLTRPPAERTKGFRSAVTVDEIRKVGRFLSMSAHDGGYRVVIVDPADDMNISAANALLKNLEEPPKRTLFVLVTHSPGRLPATIRSRCRLVRMDPLPEPELFSALDALGIAAPENPAERGELQRRAAGSVREAVLLTRYGGLEIAAAVETALAAPTFDHAHAGRLADAVTARDRPLQFQLFNDRLLEAITRRAQDAALSGEAGPAGKLAELWEDTRRAIAESDVYNLDRRQHVTGTLIRAHGTIHGQEP